MDRRWLRPRLRRGPLPQRPAEHDRWSLHLPCPWQRLHGDESMTTTLSAGQAVLLQRAGAGPAGEPAPGAENAAHRDPRRPVPDRRPADGPGDGQRIRLRDILASHRQPAVTSHCRSVNRPAVSRDRGDHLLDLRRPGTSSMPASRSDASASTPPPRPIAESGGCHCSQSPEPAVWSSGQPHPRRQSSTGSPCGHPGGHGGGRPTDVLNAAVADEVESYPLAACMGSACRLGRVHCLTAGTIITAAWVR